MKRPHFSQFFTVLSYEFMNFLHSKLYIGMTIAMVAVMMIVLSIPAISQLVSNINPAGPADPKADPKSTVYVVDRTGSAPALEWLQQALPDVRLATGLDTQVEALRGQVRSGDARAVFVIESASQFTAIVRRSGLGDLTTQRLHNALDGWFRSNRLAGFGLSPGEITAVMQPASLSQIETASETGKSMEQAYLSTYVLLMLLYMTVMIYGQMVATSVASEKSNRSMEMLVTSADPMSLMFGKVIGSGLAGLLQVAIFIVSAFGFYRLNAAHYANMAMVRSAFEMPAQTLLLTILFYLLGYFMYAFLYGALGSLASRTEDINNSIMPLVLLFVTAMMLSFIGMINPEAPINTVVSLIPLFAPMTMFVRMNMTDVPLYQVLISIALMLATIYGLGWLSARIYRIGILMYGKPPRIRELVRILKSESATK